MAVSFKIHDGHTAIKLMAERNRVAIAILRQEIAMIECQRRIDEINTAAMNERIRRINEINKLLDLQLDDPTSERQNTINEMTEVVNAGCYQDGDKKWIDDCQDSIEQAVE